jgi:hypothetical protein
MLVVTFLFEPALFGKPVPTFPDHALKAERWLFQCAKVPRNNFETAAKPFSVSRTIAMKSNPDIDGAIDQSGRAL